MTTPQLERMKFWIVKPKEATNYIHNPSFEHPELITGWSKIGTGTAMASDGTEQRFSTYSLKCDPPMNNPGGVYYSGLKVGLYKPYTFSVYVKGYAGSAMRIEIRDGTAIKATTPFVATGYWQRVEVSYTTDAASNDGRVYVIRDAAANFFPFYVDGAQFEDGEKATTFFDGYSPGCRWTAGIRNSPSVRTAQTGLGGELICINDYARIISVHGLGNGQWNQILTDITSGGALYQTHTRKARNFSMVLTFEGNNQGELQANRNVILDALRPDLLANVETLEQFGLNMPHTFRGHEQRIIRYQGFDADGNEATQPVDIVCVFQPSLNDTPDTPVFQKDILNFTIPSGLLQGAYNEGTRLDFKAEFAVEGIVKRDKDGNWCKWTGSGYESLIGLLADAVVSSIVESPDGKIYAGGTFGWGGTYGPPAIARWNSQTDVWEYIETTNNYFNVNCMIFDATGNLYVGGALSDVGSANGDGIVKITNLGGTPNFQALGTGCTGGNVTALAFAPNGDLYVGGTFTSAGGVANTQHIAKWNGTTWSSLSTTTLNNDVFALAFAPNGDLYIGGSFTNADYPYLCKYNNGTYSVVGQNTDINNRVFSLAFAPNGDLYVGGAFENLGLMKGTNRIAKWNGSSWSELGVGTNAPVNMIVTKGSAVWVGGGFTSAGGLDLTDRVAVWNNGAWNALDIDLPGDAYIDSILHASDGSIYLGGLFSTANPSPYIGPINAMTGVVSYIKTLETSTGSANTYPVIGITGPGWLHAITNYSTGKSIQFNALYIQEGEWLSFNLDPVHLSFSSGWAGRGNLLRYVSAGSDYGDFYLKAGGNTLSIFMTETGENTRAQIIWTPKFWGLDGAILS